MQKLTLTVNVLMIFHHHHCFTGREWLRTHVGGPLGGHFLQDWSMLFVEVSFHEEDWPLQHSFCPFRAARYEMTGLV